MWRRNYQPPPQDKSDGYPNDAERWHPIVRSNRAKTLLLFGFVIIAVSAATAIDSVLIISLGFRYARYVWYPSSPAKLETPRTLTCSIATEPRRVRRSPQFNLPRALAQVSSAEPDKVYPQWPVSYLAAYGTVPYNDRRLLVEPEISSFVQFRALDYGTENCSLHSGIRVRGDGDRARRIYH
jgi:hypothetical protein